MIGILFFLFEFYDDQLLAFMVLVLVWLCELFTLIRFGLLFCLTHYQFKVCYLSVQRNSDKVLSLNLAVSGHQYRWSSSPVSSCCTSWCSTFISSRMHMVRTKVLPYICLINHCNFRHIHSLRCFVQVFLILPLWQPLRSCNTWFYTSGTVLR